MKPRKPTQQELEDIFRSPFPENGEKESTDNQEQKDKKENIDWKIS